MTIPTPLDDDPEDDDVGRVGGFELGRSAELDEFKAFLDARRDAVMRAPAELGQVRPAWMGRMFVLGALDDALWHMRRRFRGIDS